MPQTPLDDTQASLAMTRAFVMSGVYPPRDGPAGGAFLDEIFTFAFNFAPGGTATANGQVLQIAQNQAVFSLIGTTYGGNGTTTFALPNLGGVTMIGTGQGPGLSPENLGVLDGASSVTLTRSQLPSHLGGTSQSFSNYQPSLPVTYMICVSGIYPSRDGGGAVHDIIGEVMPFAGTFAPTDYLPADGRLLQISQNTALFSLIGTTYGGDGMTTFALPDLRGRTIIGASQFDPLGELVGSPTVTLSNTQAPNGFTSGVQPFENPEPSLALNYLIALNGIYPSQSSGSGVDPTTPFLGEVIPFAGNFAPSGWALCAGQVLPINQNQALFSLLGTIYGGDGRTTFALPDLRGRTVLGTSTNVTIGSQLGANFPTVTSAQLPTGPNPLPPAGTSAEMILRGANTSPSAGQYEIYDISNNAILTSYPLGQVGTNWQFVGLSGFFGSDTGGMLLRNSSTGAFEVYDISNNNITNAALLGTVGMNWQVMGFGNFSSLGEADMIMRNTATGGLEVYDVSNNQITNAAFMGTVGLNWQIVGFGNFSSVPGETDMIMRNTTTGGFEVYDIANNQITGAAFLGTVGLDWQVAGFGPMHGRGESDMVLRNVNTGAFLAYDISNNQITSAAAMGQIALDWQLGGFATDPPSGAIGASDGATSQLVQTMASFGAGSSGAADSTVPLGADASQQPFLTTPQHA